MSFVPITLAKANPKASTCNSLQSGLQQHAAYDSMCSVQQHEAAASFTACGVRPAACSVLHAAHTLDAR
eukprot:14754982-Alexandrium_andersonii.AAC.1